MTRIPPERLAELRQRRDEIRKQDYATYGLSYEEDIADIVDEIEGLLAELAAKAAECERLRAALTGIASDVCWMDCRKRHPKEWKSQPREHPEAHDENCPKRIAHDALYPESTE